MARLHVVVTDPETNQLTALWDADEKAVNRLITDLSKSFVERQQIPRLIVEVREVSR